MRHCLRNLYNGFWPRSIFTIIVVSEIWLIGCSPNPEHSKDTTLDLPIVSVSTQIVESKPRMIFEEVVGMVQAKHRATLESKLSGRINTLNANLGKSVQSGDLLVRIDVAEIKARLEQTEASLEQAERAWKRVSTLFEQEAATRAEYDAAQSRSRIANGAVAEARAIMNHAEIVAPFDGVVTNKWVNLGDLAAPGKPLIGIEDPTALELVADLPQTIASGIRTDSRLVVQADGVSGDATGRVSEVSPAADSVTRTIRIKVDLPEKGRFISGQFARLRVPIGERRFLRVPEASVVRRGQMEVAFVVVDEHAQLRLVKTGKQIHEEVEILSGLHEGDFVVIEDVSQLMDGQPVNTR